jgi:hypothetical protein
VARKLLVEIVGDSSSLERSLRSAGAEAGGFGSKLAGVAKTAALVAGGAAIGGLALVLDKSVHAAMEGQAAQAALDAALRATHQSVKKMTPALEEANAAARRLGFTDAESETALSRLEIATGNTTAAIKDEGVAMDIARFKHTSLTNASQMLAMAMTGSQRAAKQLGITVPPVTTNLDALKATHEKLTTAAGQADEAHAKLLDKMATGQAVIAAVTDKVHGQAQAYAETAAGGMASFSAQVEFMEQKLGNALLPTLVSVMTWVNDHWPQIQAVFQTVFQAVGTAIDFVKPYVQRFIALSEQVVARVRADWPQISADITKAMNTIRDIVNAVVTVAQAIWARFGSTITTIAERTGAAVISVLRNLAGVVEGIFQLIADVLHGRWGAAWDDVKKIVSNALQAVKTILVTEVENFRDEALALGKAILEGIVAGLENAAGMVKSAVEDLASKIPGWAKKILGISSPSKVMADQVGAPLGAGVIQGWLEGTVDLPSKMSATLRAAVDAGIKVVSAAQSQFQSAFSGFSSIADQMFSGIAGSQQTEAGKKLAALTSAHDAADMKAQIAAARAALAQAQQTQKFEGLAVTPDMSLQDQIALFQQNRQAVVDAQKQLNDLLYQQKVAALTAQAAAEQKQLDATNAVRQIQFDKALAQLELHLQKTHASTATAMAAITKLLEKYGVTFSNVGADMGRAWVQGLRDAIASAAQGSGSLAKAIASQAAGIKVPHLDTGGFITQSGIAMVHKGETVVPPGKSGGGNVYLSVSMPNYLGDKRAASVEIGTEIAAALRANGIPSLTAAIQHI